LTRIAVTYQRPLEDTFHGGVRHIRGFVEGLARSFDLEVVAPRPFYDPHEGREPGLMLRLENTGRANVHLLRFILREARTSRRRRAALLLSFDFYTAPLTLLWAKIARVPFVYYVQDYMPELVASMRRSQQRGARLLWALRAPIEHFLLRESSEILVVTEEIKARLVQDGFAERRIRVCGFTHPPPTADPEAIQRWTSRLGLDKHTGVVFLGNLGYPPNLHAATYVTETLAPAVGRAQPEVRILLVGPGTNQYKGKAPANVEPLGPVDDLDGLLFACHVGIAPLDFGSGISGKVRDYLLHGLISVVTPAASQGIPPSCDSAVVCPMDRFTDTLLVVLHAGKAVPGHLRPVSPEIQRAYSGDTSIRSVSDDLQGMLSEPSPD